jgi:hypothetical protein
VFNQLEEEDVPVNVALIVDGSFKVALALPLTLTAVPVFVPSLSAI